MKSFDYIIKDEVGIHARPAGLIVMEAKKYKSSIMLSCRGKTVSATKLLSVMTIGAEHSDILSVQIEGEDENIAFAELKNFFENNL